MKKMHIGIIIAIILIAYWYTHDHPQTVAPAKQGYLEITQIAVG